MSEQLRPCPFCGGEQIRTNPPATYSGYMELICMDCVAIVRFSNKRSDYLSMDAINDAIKAWNRRDGEGKIVIQRAMTMVKKYRKRPIVIEAVKFTGQTADLHEFCGDCFYEPVDNAFEPFIRTLEGKMTISIGDYIIKGVNGEFYPCKADIFEKTYELMNNDSEVLDGRRQRN